MRLDYRIRFPGGELIPLTVANERRDDRLLRNFVKAGVRMSEPRPCSGAVLPELRPIAGVARRSERTDRRRRRFERLLGVRPEYVPLNRNAGGIVRAGSEPAFFRESFPAGGVYDSWQSSPP